VFGLPHEIIRAQEIHRKRSQVIHPFVLTETSVRTIMHHIKTDGGSKATQHQAFHDRPKCGRSKKHQVNVNSQKAYHQDDSFEKQAEIAGRRFAYLLKIFADPPF
jgi:hypothetical protein